MTYPNNDVHVVHWKSKKKRSTSNTAVPCRMQRPQAVGLSVMAIAEDLRGAPCFFRCWFVGDTYTQMLHVWDINLHLSDFWGNVGKYSIHEACGID